MFFLVTYQLFLSLKGPEDSKSLVASQRLTNYKTLINTQKKIITLSHEETMVDDHLIIF